MPPGRDTTGSSWPSRASVWRRHRLVLLVTGTALLAACASGTPRKDVLWRIVSECLDPGRPDYCARCLAPIEDSCGTARDCRGSAQIWAETPEYVAIRDIKMCGCPLGFVHGLALPRTRVTGIEDLRRPAGIWTFAWETAQRRIPDEGEIALAVNPPGQRTQDQLHVHLVRLAPGARARIDGRMMATAATLDQVWAAAARTAAAAALDEYGVLVTRDDTGREFQIAVTAGSPEGLFTLGTCR